MSRRHRVEYNPPRYHCQVTACPRRRVQGSPLPPLRSRRVPVCRPRRGTPPPASRRKASRRAPARPPRSVVEDVVLQQSYAARSRVQHAHGGVAADGAAEQGSAGAVLELDAVAGARGALACRREGNAARRGRAPGHLRRAVLGRDVGGEVAVELAALDQRPLVTMVTRPLPSAPPLPEPRAAVSVPKTRSVAAAMNPFEEGARRLRVATRPAVRARRRRPRRPPRCKGGRSGDRSAADRPPPCR